MIVSFLLALFAIYAVLGWICECSYVRVMEKHWVNRGFMVGPYIPIYACGAMIVLYGISPYIHNPLVFFLLAVVSTTILEYATSVFMEQVFHARWWDYSNYRFNFQGRVCLLNSTLFGLMACGVRYVIQPFLAHELSEVPPLGIWLFVGIFYALFSMDFVYTLRQLIIRKQIIEKMESLLTDASSQIDSELDVHLNLIEEQLKLQKEEWENNLTQFHALANSHLSKAFPHTFLKTTPISINHLMKSLEEKLDIHYGKE